jgi:hypothetical protein
MAIARLLEIATQVYQELGLTLDRLPYTAEFDNAHRCFCQLSGHEHTKAEVWWYLLDVRKRGLARPTRRRRRSATV